MKIAKLEKYISEESDDLLIENDKLNSKMMSLPQIHSKWLKYFYRESMLLLKYEEEEKKIFRKKFEFYLTQYDVEIKSNQVKWYVESDDEYIRISRKVNIQNKVVSYLEDVVKKVNNLNFLIKNIIDWKKFISGNG